MKHLSLACLFALALAVPSLGGCGDDDAAPAAAAGAGGAAAGTGGSGGDAGSGGASAGTGGSSAGAGGAAAGTGGAGGSGQSGTVTQDVKASEGGKVQASGASVDIPAGALAQDTTITVTVSEAAGQPDAASIVAKVYDFGPSGTTFLKPVPMAIDFDASKVPAGKKAVIAFLDAGKWVPLADSAVAGSQVTATTTHFTPFTVVLALDGTTSGDTCASIPFSACGGDVVGTWTYEKGCLDVDNPFAGSCATATFALTIDISGTIKFEASTYQLDLTATSTQNITLPKSCVPGGDCAAFGSNEFMDTGATCNKMQTDAPKTANEMGSWTSSGTKLSLAGKNGTQDIDYCVEGSTLKLFVVSSDGKSSTIYQLSK